MITCQNCDWTGSEEDADPIEDLEQRVAPGELCPAGECPECGALCSVDELPAHTVKIVLAYARERGMIAA